MLATKNATGEARSAAILRSASFVNPSMVSVYMALFLPSKVGCCLFYGFADDDQRRGGEARALYGIGEKDERREHRPLARQRRVLHHAGGHARLEAGREHLRDDLAQSRKSHIDDQRGTRFG